MKGMLLSFTSHLSVPLTEIGMTFGGVPVFRWNFVFVTKKTQICYASVQN